VGSARRSNPLQKDENRDRSTGLGPESRPETADGQLGPSGRNV